MRAEQIRLVAEVALLAVDDQLVRQAARLGALPAVGRAAAEGFGGQALPRLRHAQRPVDEHFHGHIDRRGDLRDLLDGEFAGEDGSPDAEPRSRPGAGSRRD